MSTYGCKCGCTDFLVIGDVFEIRSGWFGVPRKVLVGRYVRCTRTGCSREWVVKGQRVIASGVIRPKPEPEPDADRRQRAEDRAGREIEPEGVLRGAIPRADV